MGAMQSLSQPFSFAAEAHKQPKPGKRMCEAVFQQVGLDWLTTSDDPILEDSTGPNV